MDASVFKRPNKPKFVYVKDRGKLSLEGSTSVLSALPVIDKNTECHVTPLDVAKRMVIYADPLDNDKVLEPEGGSGNIVNEIISYGVFDRNITTVEKHLSLFSVLNNRFCDTQVNIINNCFLAFALNSVIHFEKIIMNPPFKHVIRHFESAIDILADNGVIIALVPSNFEYKGIIVLEYLDCDTFSTTKVETKIIKFEK